MAVNYGPNLHESSALHSKTENATRFNRLVKIPPTIRAVPVSDLGAVSYGVVFTGDTTATASQEKLDPTTGLGTCKIIFGASDNAGQRLTFNNLSSPFSLPDDDIYLVPVWLESTPVGADAPRVRLMTSDLVSPDGNSYRWATWNNTWLRKGWNILSVKNTETQIGANEYGNLAGTSSSVVPLQWAGVGTTASNSTVRSLHLIFENCGGRTIHVGAIHTAKKKWCTSVVIFCTDDGVGSTLSIFTPVLRRYGWNAVHNIVASTTSGLTSGRLALSDLKKLQAEGDELWGHGASHDSFTTATTLELQRLIREIRNYGRANGIPSIGRYMAYPYNDYNDAVVAEMRAQGYKLARGLRGNFMSSWIPGLGPLYLPCIAIETQNSWNADAALRGCILRGQAVMVYMHNAVAGGGGDTYPGPTSYYEEHLKRWCAMIAAYELSGDVEVMTPTQYFRSCGIDPAVDDMVD